MLEVSVGTGTNLPLIRNSMGDEGTIVGLDISPNMLDQCRAKLSAHGMSAELVVGEGAHLPFGAEQFDAVFHHGGLAEFGDRAGAIGEMWRVARPGATLVICDAGRPTDRRLSVANWILMKFQPEYDQPPPLDDLPPDATDTRLSWFHAGGWYLIQTTKPS